MIYLKERLEELLKNDTESILEKRKKRLEKWANQWIDSEAEGLTTTFAKRMSESN